MADDRKTRRPADDADKRAVPSAAESWRRNVEILDLVNRIRDARARRAAARNARRPTARPPR